MISFDSFSCMVDGQSSFQSESEKVHMVLRRSATPRAFSLSISENRNETVSEKCCYGDLNPSHGRERPA